MKSSTSVGFSVVCFIVYCLFHSISSKIAAALSYILKGANVAQKLMLSTPKQPPIKQNVSLFNALINTPLL